MFFFLLSLSFCATPLGLALVDAYRAMGRHALTEPKLRAQQELDCKAIATNQRTKQAVLTDQRAAMRVFVLVISRMECTAEYVSSCEYISSFVGRLFMVIIHHSFSVVYTFIERSPLNSLLIL